MRCTGNNQRVFSLLFTPHWHSLTTSSYTDSIVIEYFLPGTTTETTKNICVRGVQQHADALILASFFILQQPGRSGVALEQNEQAERRISIVCASALTSEPIIYQVESPESLEVSQGSREFPCESECR